MAHILVWDLETIPDLMGYAAAHGHDGKTEDEIREALGDSAVKVERPLYPQKAAATVANCRYLTGKTGNITSAVGPSGLPILMDTFVRLTTSPVVSIAKIRGCVRAAVASSCSPATCASPRARTRASAAPKSGSVYIPVVVGPNVFHISLAAVAPASCSTDEIARLWCAIERSVKTIREAREGKAMHRVAA
jgi:hypothetical protein